MFVTLPLAFGQLPGGQVFAVLFFLMVTLAAWTSAISLLEPAVTWLMEHFELSRLWAVLCLGSVGWLLGVGALLSFNVASHWRMLGLNFFDFLDVITASVLLPATGFLTAAFVGWQVNKSISRDELALRHRWSYSGWLISVRFIAPFAVVVVFLVNIYHRWLA